MPDRYPPISEKIPHMLHGGDYNPDQWPEDIWPEDVRLMKLAGCNAMSVGIFSWAHLEPREGHFTFDWLDRLLDLLATNGIGAVLATPSGSKPAWLSTRHPEVCRVNPQGLRDPHAGRHNHCYTSPAYREKVKIINTKLAERYQDHPALLLWHISNEYNGCCHCKLCYAAFREWLRNKYADLDALNAAWWSSFWSHDFTEWDQIAPHDTSIHGLQLDWKRFATDQTISFFKNEIAPLRHFTPDLPVTTNFMGTFPGLDYQRFAEHLDIASWDSYPWYHDRPDMWETGCSVSFTHDIYRNLKGGKPFMLMESTPSMTNWQPIAKLKRPGIHRLASLQAIAHGSDTVQYFQWRAGRGGAEKFHGAVVDHSNSEHTRFFHDVADVGEILQKLDPVVGTATKAEAAVIYDWQNDWAIDMACGPRRDQKDYQPTCVRHYRQFWQRGIPVDVISMLDNFTGYRLLVAPMLYMLRPGVAKRLQEFVENGGTLVSTYWTGIADENDICFMGGRPGPLRELFGVWAEEIDALYDDEPVSITIDAQDELGFKGSCQAGILCDLIHAETATVLGKYASEFYAGRPCLTVNTCGKGRAYYIASRNDDSFLQCFYDGIIGNCGLTPILDTALPTGVTVQKRSDGKNDYLFLLNFTAKAHTIDLGSTSRDLITGKELPKEICLSAYGAKVVER